MKKPKFENVVSLGYFCSVALENQRMGLRNISLPFDWLITSNFVRVLELIQTRFCHFLKEEDFWQEGKVNPKFYYDAYNDIRFYHDFTATEELSQQITQVREKYQRRIQRLYHVMSSPTLFVRYCKDIEEMHYINCNYEEICATLKEYNQNNHIVFVYDQKYDWHSEIDAYFVIPDKGDTVARMYLKKNVQLRDYIQENVRSRNRRANKVRYWKDTFGRIMNKVVDKVMLVVRRKTYVHHQQL